MFERLLGHVRQERRALYLALTDDVVKGLRVKYIHAERFALSVAEYEAAHPAKRAKTTATDPWLLYMKTLLDATGTYGIIPAGEATRNEIVDPASVRVFFYVTEGHATGGVMPIRLGTFIPPGIVDFAGAEVRRIEIGSLSSLCGEPDSPVAPSRVVQCVSTMDCFGGRSSESKFHVGNIRLAEKGRVELRYLKHASLTKLELARRIELLTSIDVPSKAPHRSLLAFPKTDLITMLDDYIERGHKWPWERIDDGRPGAAEFSIVSHASAGAGVLAVNTAPGVDLLVERGSCIDYINPDGEYVGAVVDQVDNVTGELVIRKLWRLEDANDLDRPGVAQFDVTCYTNK